MSRRAARSLTPEVPPLSPLPPPTQSLGRIWKVALGLVFAVYFGLGLGHLVTAPVLPPNTGSLINAPDEPAHIAYVRIVAEQHRLPTKEDSGSTYEWHQPPLAYMLMSPLFRLGPAALRAFSLVCGAGSIAVIFLTARRLFPNDAPLAVCAAGLAALIPMRQGVYASTGNDALLELLFSAALFQITLAFTHGFTGRRGAVMGLLIGGAMLTKANGILLIPVALAAVYALWRGGEPLLSLGRSTVYMVSMIVCLTSIWFTRNIQLYHELTPVTAFMHEFEGTSKAVDWIGQPRTVNGWTGALEEGPPMDRLGYVELLANWTFRSTFAAYTPLRLASAGIPRFVQPPTFYIPFALLLAAGLAGMTRLHFRRNEDFTAMQIAVIRVFTVAIVLVTAGFAGFTWTFFQAQGRYLYPAMLPESILLALGVRAMIPPTHRDGASLGILALMAVLGAAFLAFTLGHT